MQTLLPRRSGTMSPAGVADAHRWPATTGAHVRAVMVATADGAARSPQGRSGGISTAGDRLLFGTIRGLSDVILVGAETVRREGYGPPRARPELNHLRRAAGQEATAQVAIVTRSGDLDPTSALFSRASRPPLILTTSDLPAERRAALEDVAEIVELGRSQVDIRAAIDLLASRGMHRIACEGGPTLLGEVAAADCLDDLCLTVTPLLAGGSYVAGSPLPRILAGARLADPPRSLRLQHVIEDGGTLFLQYSVERP